ncbi:hypothetical protein [Martelella alba]|uniref:Uncharacterized protein n=1 Tax=Martelella alba TaxID=2590451 RepID=A0ABY2SML5_9HYPH|nr:hypothetical protein [Martelella alba]TKI06230.1 hypothetical protein FCN80_10305 [Martelella alba]
MSPEIENALRSVARRCRDEILKSIKGKPKTEYDSIFTTHLDKYAAQIQCLPPGTYPAKQWLAYFVRLIDREQRGEV